MEQEFMTFNPPLMNAYGRRFVIPDIHGCYNTLKCLLDKIKLTKSDQLFLLGDYIDRGPYGNNVLDLIFQLIKDGYLIFPLRGNHEQMLLDSENRRLSGKDIDVPRLHKHTDLSDKDGNIKVTYLNFMKSLPFYFELDHYFLVHAGFNLDSDNPFGDFFNMVWITNNEVNTNLFGTKKIIHGHTTTDLELIKRCIEKGFQIIPLDNGCYFKNRDHKGNLLCLELGNMDLFIQKNIDK